MNLYIVIECKVLIFVYVIIVRIVKVEIKWLLIFYMGYVFLLGLDYDKNIILYLICVYSLCFIFFVIIKW